jgi:transposase
MSLKALPIPAIPDETARVACAAFPSGTLCLQLRAALGTLYTDADFADLFPTRGQPAEAPWRLALVTVLQVVEDLSDRQAADAVRSRLDWKYALSLELTDSGFDHTVLSEFRTRLVQGDAAQRLLDALLEQCTARGWLKARGRQRTDSTHVLAAVRALNRLECVGETLRHALNVLAEVAPDWLHAYVAHEHPEWVERYSRRIEEYRLPSGTAARQAYAETIGADGWDLLGALEQPSAPAWLREISVVQRLQRVWAQQYQPRETGGHWRPAEELPPAGQVQNSPYDPDARYGKKRETTWVGYKVHLTETCDPDTPHLLTQVTTTPAATADETMLPAIQDDLARHEVLPSTHLVDAGYIDAETLATSRAQFGVDLVGPTRGNYCWQARQLVREQTRDPAQEPFDRSHFVIDWTARRVTCPEGRTSTQWTPAEDRRPRVPRAVINVAFAAVDCRRCPSHTRCTTQARRTLTLHPQAHEEALRAARERELTPAFALAYAQRAGVESAHAQGLRLCGLRRSRYVGLAKTHLQHILTAVALNLVRLSAWLSGTPLAPTRQSTFARLMTQAA